MLIHRFTRKGPTTGDLEKNAWHWQVVISSQSLWDHLLWSGWVGQCPPPPHQPTEQQTCSRDEDRPCLLCFSSLTSLVASPFSIPEQDPKGTLAHLTFFCSLFPLCFMPSVLTCLLKLPLLTNCSTQITKREYQSCSLKNPSICFPLTTWCPA